MAAKEFIVAIEFGSSKMTGIAGKKNLDGSITVLAVTTENSSAFIKKGVVYNIDKTAQCITNIIKKLETTLKTHITQVFVGVGGQSIISVKNNIVNEFEQPTKVTQNIIDDMADANRNMVYPDKEILDATAQEFLVDNQQQIDPVGIECKHLEGSFLNILERRSFYSNLNKCFDTAGINVADMYLAPFALADSVLTEAEKRSGCALVDIGADTTTVAVYFRNILRHLAVIPLGSANVTKDIMSLQIEEEEAEKMKLKYGNAWTDDKDIDENLKYPIDSDREVDSIKFIEIVECRMEEIIKNAWSQIQLSEFSEKLLGGIVITGGGSNMKNIEKAFNIHTKVEKIRIAKFVTHTIDSNNPLITNHNGTMNTVLALLSRGEQNCAGVPLSMQNDMFGGNDATTTTEIHNKPPRQANEIAPGVVRTEAEKQAAEEEARRRKEAEEKAKQEAEEAERQRLEEERKQNSFFNKMKKKTKNFFENMIKEED